MGQKTRAKVLDCQYYQDKNLIVWTLQPVGEEKSVRMGFRATDLAHCLGINIEIPPDAVERFCKLITGKEINWVMEIDKNSFLPVKDQTEDQIEEMNQRLNDYPIFEIAEIEKQ